MQKVRTRPQHQESLGAEVRQGKKIKEPIGGAIARHQKKPHLEAKMWKVRGEKGTKIAN
jgi:hypothetical protein